MKKILLRLLLLLGTISLMVFVLFMIYVYPFMNKMKKTETITVDPQFTLILGGGGNSGILLSDSIALVIDTKMNEAADALSARVHHLAGTRRIIVVNTHIHTDHTSGNKYYKGHTIIAGGHYDPAFWAKENGPDAPPTIWLTHSMTIPMGDDTATLLNLAWNAHTQSDLIVYLHRRKVLFCGDIVLNGQSPAMFTRYGASGDGYLRAFVFFSTHYDIAQVVPGHGPVGGPEVIQHYKEFFEDMKLAALDSKRESELVAKYKDYTQIPYLMSPEATIAFFRKK